MARPKGAKNKTSKNKIDDSLIEEVVEEIVEFICPKRGKVKQKVKIKKIKSVKKDAYQTMDIKDPIENLDKDDSYDDSELLEE